MVHATLGGAAKRCRLFLDHYRTIIGDRRGIAARLRLATPQILAQRVRQPRLAFGFVHGGLSTLSQA
jgi:hypothetical protein